AGAGVIDVAHHVDRAARPGRAPPVPVWPTLIDHPPRVAPSAEVRVADRVVARVGAAEAEGGGRGCWRVDDRATRGAGGVAPTRLVGCAHRRRVGASTEPRAAVARGRADVGPRGAAVGADLVAEVGGAAGACRDPAPAPSDRAWGLTIGHGSRQIRRR